MSSTASPDSATRLASSLNAFHDPASVAVVGASNNQAKWGYWLARGALQGVKRRQVWLVNHSAETVQGERAYHNIGALPEVPELVALCVPPQFVESVVAEALEAGTKAFLCITADVPDQERIAGLINAAGARIIGPNSLGLYDATTSLQLAWGNFTPGPLAVISQSGQLGLEIAGLTARVGLGISRFASVGNQLDVSASDLLDDLVHHEATNLVALYLESFAGGAHLISSLQRLAAAGKRTIVVTTGASEGSKRLAYSHTGSMTSTLDTVDAACRVAGAIRVSTPSEVVDVARYLSVAPIPKGNRLAIVSDSGGQGGIAADLASATGLNTPIFSAELQGQLARFLPAGATVANPVDLAGAGEADLETYAALSELLAASGEVDAIVLSGYFGLYGQDTPTIEETELAVVERLGRLTRSTGLPLLVHSMSNDSRAVTRMWEQNIPVFSGIEYLMRTLGHARGFNDSPGRALKTPKHAGDKIDPGYWAARNVLRSRGIAVPSAALALGTDELRSTAKALSGPFVLKAGWLSHKSEHGGVALGLPDLAALTNAYEDMVSRLGPGEYVIEEHDTRSGVVEMLIGGRRDRDFGPTVTVGAGGTEAELWRDVCIELAPVDETTAREMIHRLRCIKLLDGWRGRPAVDIESLVSMVVAVSEAVAADPNIAEFEVNPVRVGTDGALAVDALITTYEPS